jgi:hypothetical protein
MFSGGMGAIEEDLPSNVHAERQEKINADFIPCISAREHYVCLSCYKMKASCTVEK